MTPPTFAHYVRQRLTWRYFALRVLVMGLGLAGAWGWMILSGEWN